MKYKVRDMENGKEYIWSIKQMISEINRDRSDTWLPYDASDWMEGWKHWVEGEAFEIVSR